MKLNQVFGSIGAELENISLHAPIGGGDQLKFRNLLDKHGVLIIRGQELDEAQLITFSRGFGDLATFHEEDKRSATAPEIFRISNVEQDGQGVRSS